MTTMYRQGDVLITRIEDSAPTGAQVSRDSGRIVLAYGEATGHAHAIADRDADLFELPEARDKEADELWDQVTRILRVRGEEGVNLRHEEHGAIAIPPGTYRVVRQREYVPGAPSFSQFVED